MGADNTFGDTNFNPKMSSEGQELSDNELIAEFMGANYDKLSASWTRTGMLHKGYFQEHKPEGIEYAYSTEQLKYDTSWDWLMPVVEKIESIGVNVDIYREGTRIKWMRNGEDFFLYDKTSHDENLKIGHVYHSIFEFIKWFKSHQQYETKD